MVVIFGTALLAVCYLLGIVAGDALGILIGVKANVGGVGFAMILSFLPRVGRKPTRSLEPPLALHIRKKMDLFACQVFRDESRFDLPQRCPKPIH